MNACLSLGAQLIFAGWAATGIVVFLMVGAAISKALRRVWHRRNTDTWSKIAQSAGWLLLACMVFAVLVSLLMLVYVILDAASAQP